MENITYYYAQTNQSEPLDKIVSDPLFKEVVAYFTERQDQEIILRQIKADIPTNSNLELYLDKLIKYNLIERKNRRYSLSFPIYANESRQILPESLIELLEGMKQESKRTNYFLFGEWLWSLLFDEEQGDYFFGVKDSSNGLPLFQRREEGNDALRFVSIFTAQQVPFDLANYFNLLSKRQALPQIFEPLQNLVGDVDLNYFIQQIQKVIRTVNRNKTRERKVNIFQEALLVTGDLMRDEENQLYFAVPLLEDQVLSGEMKVRLDQMKAELSSLWANITDENQRVFLKHQIYSTLFENGLPKQHYIHYFKL
ncbi:hypothetical protein ABID30_000249 [Enterococcus rotai]|uniref:DUF1803 domain-containing protein n=1 Tax=Enterococcus rotai TaxID=118060 RepID=A0A0U2VUR6_9ENTE|nr:DUF1803 domain-containing protein [Enterococcus rotai]ALS38063.1 hypothetical protein ATZ35_13190 [Enterococcus rotai]